jgi:uncharacterized protein (TIGR02271 family)
MAPRRHAPTDVLRSEEELDATVASHEAGRAWTQTSVEEVDVRERVPRHVEYADVERTDATETDSGQVETLPDGSISIPVFEEKLVIEKRLVVRERVIIRKRTVTEEHVVDATLRREHVDVVADDDVAERVYEDPPSTPPAPRP